MGKSFNDISKEESDKQLKNAIAGFQKKHGEVIVDVDNLPPTSFISTGIVSLDAILGGGFPVGRIVEVLGWEGSSKSSASISAGVTVQKSGGNVAIVDFEHAFNPERAETLGLNLESNFALFQPDAMEPGLDLIDDLIKSGVFKLIIVDSVAAMSPLAEIEGDYSDAQMGNAAKNMSKAMRRQKGIVHENNVCLVYVNQFRGTMNSGPGQGKVGAHGNALKYYSSIRIEVARIETLKKGEMAYGIKVRAKTIKNRVFPPYRQADYVLRFDETGFDNEMSLIEEAIKAGIVNKGGSWFSYGDIKLGQGLDNASQFLRDNPSINDEIYTQLQEEWKNKSSKKKTKKVSDEEDVKIDMETGEIIEDSQSEIIEPEVVEEIPTRKRTKN